MAVTSESGPAGPPSPAAPVADLPSAPPADPLVATEQSGRRRFTLLVCYDIVDDDVRERVAQHLAQYGPRVQLSTFELQVDGPQGLRELTETLSGIVIPECDQVRIYNLGTRPPAPTIIGCRTLEEWNDFIII